MMLLLIIIILLPLILMSVSLFATMTLGVAPILNVKNGTSTIRQYVHIGLEQRPHCWRDMDKVLSDTLEYDKVGSSASISILALLPAILVVGPIPTAKVSKLFVLSPMMGLITAGMTLGIPVKSVSPVASVIKVKDLCLAGLGDGENLIATYGLLSSSIHVGLQHNQVTSLAEFHRWYTLPTPLARLHQQVFATPKSSSTIWRITLFSHMFVIVQYLILSYLFMIVYLLGSEFL
ncbi:hypothetical protein BZA77DRAFT_325550, partial [Pyronema omphalodes]